MHRAECKVSQRRRDDMLKGMPFELIEVQYGKVLQGGT